MKNSNFFAHLKNDLPASIVVFLVAVPLCLGIALASGAPLFSGIIAGFVGGMVVTAFSGSSLGVSGPAAGLAAIVLAAIPSLGGFEIFLVSVVIAGLVQILLGVLQAGIIGYYFPNSVIKGMLAGIGIIIFLKQIPHAFGYDKVPEGNEDFVQPDGENTISELSNMLDYITPGALLISVLSLAILILWEQKFFKKLSFTQWIQGPLVVVVLGIVLGTSFEGTSMALRAGEQFVNLPSSSNMDEFLAMFTLPDFSHWNNPQVWVTGVTLAIVASLETLLCVEATDKLDPQKRVTPTNQELRAQGIGNVVSGMIGGLPVTQVIVRSSANIQSGGKTRASAFLHGVLIFVCVMAIPNVLNMIPLASLAAILLVVGYKLAKPTLFKDMWSRGKTDFIPFIVTILGIVFTDLLKGIGLGMAVGIFFILYKNYQKPFFINAKEYVKGQPLVLQLAESVSFLNKGSISKSLMNLPDNTEVIIDATQTKDMHPDVLEIINDFLQNAPSRDIKATFREFAGDQGSPIREFEEVVTPDELANKSNIVKNIFKKGSK